MYTKEMIEKQYFIVNLMNVDIADMMWAKECRGDDEDEIDDAEYVEELLVEEGLKLEELEDSIAIVRYRDKALYIRLANNDKEYRMSIMEYLEYPKYKKLTGYFLGPTNVILKKISEQVGGIIDTNYGFKFMIEIG